MAQKRRRQLTNRITPTEPITPRWDGMARELWFGNVLVKRFRVPAESQRRILTEFEESGWPRCIDDPLPAIDGGDQWRRLKKAIHGLNKSQENPLIEFHGNGTGDGIWWEYIGPK
jgi:hypothetical protein